MLPAKRTAKIRLQVALQFARDLQAQRNGDTARFDRMVDARGKGIINREVAIINIAATVASESVKSHWPATCMALGMWLREVRS